jgi:predicted ArsR family transcriptional regulator
MMEPDQLGGHMAGSSWERRFFSTTTGRILALLRRRRQTVDDLAGALTLSDNAVRNQLYTLERDGLVAIDGTRRGPGKPAWLYRLSPEADRLFPKPYAVILDHLLGVLSERMTAEEIDAALVEVGQRMAAGIPAQTGGVEARLPSVIDAFASIGGLAEVEATDGCVAIQGYDCPLARTVPEHPNACRVLESMLETALGEPVTEECDKSDPPRCRFVLAPDAVSS